MRLRVLLTGCVALTLVVGVMGLVSTATIGREAQALGRQSEAIDLIARDAAGLLVLTQEHLLHGGTRPVPQWALLHSGLSRALRDYAALGELQAAEVREAQAVATELPPLFEGLQAALQAPEGRVATARREAPADQLVNETRRISDGAFELARQVSDRRRDVDEKRRWMALSSQAVMSALVLLLAWLLLRRVLGPIARLQASAQSVREGELGARTGYGRADELGELSQAFDAMTAALHERAAALQASLERLARSEASMDHAGRIAGFGGWELDLAKGRLIWSAQTRAIHEVPPDFEPTLELALAFYEPSARARLRSAIDAATTSGTPWDLELPFTSARGRSLWVRATGAAEREGGRTVRLVGALQDVSVWREADEALREATRAAMAANEAKTAFLANMSHEIRTPMNAVIGLAYLLQKTRLDTDQQELLGHIDTASRGLLGVINDVLDLSKIEAGEMALEHAPFDLRRLVEEVVGVLRPQAIGRGITLAAELSPALPARLLGDEARLRQVLTNLVGNALKFTEEGEVRVDVGVLDPDASPLRVRLTVQDTGIGISQEVLGRLFTPFTQAETSTTRRFGGTGLGLSIVKRLVGLMDGEVEVSSTPGRGSCFEVTLPLDRADAQGADEAATRPIEVLIADDDETHRAALQALAGRLGWRSEGVASGEALVDRVRARRSAGSSPDVLVVDWRMPGIDGLQALALLHADGADGGDAGAPGVVMVSARGREAIRQAPHAELADELLGKPVDTSTLFNAVYAAVARRGGDAERLLLGSALEAAGVARLPGVRMLVADDSTINLEVARRILEREGAQVSVVQNGAQAVALLRASPQAFDAVLMDVQMPVLDGLDATRQIRGELGLTTLPLIALTAGALLSERQRALDVGMDGFVSKPFEPHALVRLLHRHIERVRGVPLPLAPRAVAAEPAVGGPGTPVWPRIEGIDGAEVRRRLDGDLPLFTRLLRRLCDEFADLALPGAEAGAASDELTGRWHKLAGSAGLLGARPLSLAAAAAETALRGAGADGADDATGARAVAAVALRRLIDEARPWLDAQDRAARAARAAPPVVAAAAPPDPQALSVWRAQLQARDLEAVTQFERLAPSLGAHWERARFDALEAAMGRLDFGAAFELAAGGP